MRACHSTKVCSHTRTCGLYSILKTHLRYPLHEYDDGKDILSIPLAPWQAITICRTSWSNIRGATMSPHRFHWRLNNRIFTMARLHLSFSREDLEAWRHVVLVEVCYLSTGHGPRTRVPPVLSTWCSKPHGTIFILQYQF